MWHIVRFHGKWGVASNYLNSFSQNMRIWIIKFFLGTEAVGLFSLASGLVSHTSSLIPLGQVMSSIIPQYAQDTNRFYSIITKSIKYQLLAYLLLGVVAFFAFPPIIIWLFPNYASALPLFKGMLLILIPSSFATIFNPVFFTLKAQKSLFFATTLRAIFIAVLAPISIILFHQAGIVVEYITTAFFYSAERYRVLKKLLPGFSLNVKKFFTMDDEDKMVLQRIKGLIISKIKR